MEKIYSAGLISQSFWFLEFKKMAGILNEGKSADEIKKICIDENLFGAVNSYRARRVYGYVANRVNVMDRTLADVFSGADISTQKLINLICIMKLDRLFFEFVYEVYRSKIILGNEELTAGDVSEFFINKANQSDEIAMWKDSTIKHLGSNYMNFLTEAGLLTEISGNKNLKRVTPPLLDPVLEAYLAGNNGTAIIKAITGVN